jgi:hypothetical protein
MRQVEYQNELGRKYLVGLPDDVPDAEAEKGIPIGPPDVVEELGLPEPFATNLHNALFDHKMWNIHVVRKNPKLLFGILQRIIRVDVHKLMEAYAKLEKDSG